MSETLQGVMSDADESLMQTLTAEKYVLELAVINAATEEAKATAQGKVDAKIKEMKKIREKYHQ